MKLKIPELVESKLREKGALEKFIANVTEYDRVNRKYAPANLHLYEHSFLEFIAHAIVWEVTPEGYEYWLGVATMDEYD